MATDDAVIRIRADASQAVSELQALRQSVTGAYKTLDRAAESFKDLKRNQQDLTRITRITAKLNKDLGKMYKKSGKDVREFNKAIKDNQRSLTAINRTYASASMRMRTFAKDLRGVALAIRNSGKNLQFMGRSIMIGMLPFANAIKKASDFARALEVAELRLMKIADLTKTELEPVADQMEKIARKFAVSRDLITDIAADFALVGFPVGDLNNLVKAANELALLGHIDVGPAKDIFISTVFAMRNMATLRGEVISFEKAVEQATGQMYLFNIVNNNTALAISDLAESIPKLIPITVQFGMSITEAAAALASMRASGISAAEGTTALRTGLLRLTSFTKIAEEKLEGVTQILRDFHFEAGIGITTIASFGEAVSRIRKDLGDAKAFEIVKSILGIRQTAKINLFIMDMEAARDQVEQTIKSMEEISGIDAFSASIMSVTEFADLSREPTQAMKDAAVALLKNNKEMGKITSQFLRGLLIQMTGVENAAAMSMEELQKVFDSDQFKMQEAKNKMKMAMMELGGIVNKMVVDHILPLVDKWVKAFNNIPDNVKKVIVIMAALAAAFGPILYGLAIIKMAFGQTLNIIAGLFYKVFTMMTGKTIAAIEAANAEAAAIQIVSGAKSIELSTTMKLVDAQMMLNAARSGQAASAVYGTSGAAAGLLAGDIGTGVGAGVQSSKWYDPRSVRGMRAARRRSTMGFLNTLRGREGPALLPRGRIPTHWPGAPSRGHHAGWSARNKLTDMWGGNRALAARGFGARRMANAREGWMQNSMMHMAFGPDALGRAKGRISGGFGRARRAAGGAFGTVRMAAGAGISRAAGGLGALPSGIRAGIAGQSVAQGAGMAGRTGLALKAQGMIAGARALPRPSLAGLRPDFTGLGGSIRTSPMAQFLGSGVAGARGIGGRIAGMGRGWSAGLRRQTPAQGAGMAGRAGGALRAQRLGHMLGTRKWSPLYHPGGIPTSMEEMNRRAWSGLREAMPTRRPPRGPFAAGRRDMGTTMRAILYRMTGTAAPLRDMGMAAKTGLGRAAAPFRGMRDFGRGFDFMRPGQQLKALPGLARMPGLMGPLMTKEFQPANRMQAMGARASAFMGRHQRIDPRAAVKSGGAMGQAFIKRVNKGFVGPAKTFVKGVKRGFELPGFTRIGRLPGALSRIMPGIPADAGMGTRIGGGINRFMRDPLGAIGRAGVMPGAGRGARMAMQQRAAAFNLSATRRLRGIGPSIAGGITSARTGVATGAGQLMAGLRGATHYPINEAAPRLQQIGRSIRGVPGAIAARAQAAKATVSGAGSSMMMLPQKAPKALASGFKKVGEALKKPKKGIESMGKSLATPVKSIKSGAKSAKEFAKGLGKSAKMGQQTLNLGKGAGKFAGGLGKAKGFLSAMLTPITAIKNILGLFNPWMLAFGILLAIAAVIFTEIKTNFDAFMKAAQPGIDAIGKAFNSLKTAIGGVIDSVLQLFNRFSTGSKEAGEEGSGIGSIIGGALKFVAFMLEVVVKQFELLAWVIGKVMDYAAPVISFVLGIIHAIANVVQGIILLFKGEWKEALQMFRGAAARMLIALVNLFEQAFRFIFGLIADFIGLIGKIPLLPDFMTDAIADAENFVRNLDNALFGPVKRKIAEMGGIEAEDIMQISDSDVRDVGGTVMDAFKTGAEDAEDDPPLPFTDPAGGMYRGATDAAIAAGTEAGEAFFDAWLAAFNKFIKLVKNNIKDKLNEVRGFVVDMYDDATNKVVEGFEAQVQAINDVIKQEQRLSQEVAYQTKRREQIRDNALRGENYRRDRSLAIYEGRIWDVRQLDLKERRNKETATAKLGKLDVDRSQELLAQERADSIDRINLEKTTYQGIRAERKIAYTDMVNDIIDHVPTTQAEFEEMAAEIGVAMSTIADQYGVTVESLVGEGPESLMTKLMEGFDPATIFRDAMDEAKEQMTFDYNWEAALSEDNGLLNWLMTYFKDIEEEFVGFETTIKGWRDRLVDAWMGAEPFHEGGPPGGSGPAFGPGRWPGSGGLGESGTGRTVERPIDLFNKLIQDTQSDELISKWMQTGWQSMNSGNALAEGYQSLNAYFNELINSWIPKLDTETLGLPGFDPNEHFGFGAGHTDPLIRAVEIMIGRITGEEDYSELMDDWANLMPRDTAAWNEFMSTVGGSTTGWFEGPGGDWYRNQGIGVNEDGYLTAGAVTNGDGTFQPFGGDVDLSAHGRVGGEQVGDPMSRRPTSRGQGRRLGNWSLSPGRLAGPGYMKRLTRAEFIAQNRGNDLQELTTQAHTRGLVSNLKSKIINYGNAARYDGIKLAIGPDGGVRGDAQQLALFKANYVKDNINGDVSWGGDMWRRVGNMVAPPDGSSRHRRGEAVDIDGGPDGGGQRSARWGWFAINASKFGLHRPYPSHTPPGEPWHHVASYAKGGLVKGLKDQAQLAMLHGGEFVMTAKSVRNIGLGALNAGNQTGAYPLTGPNGSGGVSNTSTSSVTINVDTFIGQREWFERMMSDHNISIVPAADRAKGTEGRVVGSYTDRNIRSRV